MILSKKNLHIWTVLVLKLSDQIKGSNSGFEVSGIFPPTD